MQTNFQEQNLKLNHLQMTDNETWMISKNNWWDNFIFIAYQFGLCRIMIYQKYLSHVVTKKLLRNFQYLKIDELFSLYLNESFRNILVFIWFYVIPWKISRTLISSNNDELYYAIRIHWDDLVLFLCRLSHFLWITLRYVLDIHIHYIRN